MWQGIQEGSVVGSWQNLMASDRNRDSFDVKVFGQLFLCFYAVKETAMNITNEMMFYGGMILAGASVLGMVIYLLLARMWKLKLEIRLDQEYGKNGEE